MKRVICLVVGFAALLIIFSGCEYSFSSDFGFSGLGSIKVQEDGISLDGSGLSELEVNTGVGEITIKKSPTKDIEISYKKEVKGSSDVIDEIIEKISVESEVKGDKLIIEVNLTENKSQDFWSWLSSNYTNVNVSVDVDIKVPENIENFMVSNGVGDIEISNLSGRFNVLCGVGSIEVRNVDLTGKCDFTGGTGSVNLDCDISNAEKVTAQTGVGKINIKMPKNSKFSLDASAGVGKITGNLIEPNKNSFVGENLKQDVNGGGIKLELTTGTGSISINSR